MGLFDMNLGFNINDPKAISNIQNFISQIDPAQLDSFLNPWKQASIVKGPNGYTDSYGNQYTTILDNSGNITGYTSTQDYMGNKNSTLIYDNTGKFQGAKSPAMLSQSTPGGTYQKVYDSAGQETYQVVDKGYDKQPSLLNAALPLTLAFALPGLGSSIGAALSEAGIVTAANATQIGTAIASVSVQVAQGVPLQDAVMNAAISNVVQTGSTDVAKTIVAAGNDPAVANAIASVGGSIAKTAASGGSGTDILNNAVGALAGSGVTSLTADELGTAASRAVGAAVGTAAAGGDTAKVLGAAAGALGNASTTTSTTAADTTELTPEEQAQREQNRITNAVNAAQASAEQAQPEIDARTQEIINQMQSDTAIDPAVSPAVSTADTTATQTETPVLNEEIVITPDKSVVPDANVSTTIIDTNTGPNANVAATTAKETPEIVITPEKEDDVSPTIIDTVTEPDVSKTEPAPTEKPAPSEEEVAKETVPYKPELFIFGSTTPKSRKSSALSQTINAPFYPSTGLTQALTASRPAGEIEADPSGKKRQNVWNEASLRLKDALGI